MEAPKTTTNIEGPYAGHDLFHLRDRALGGDREVVERLVARLEPHVETKAAWIAKTGIPSGQTFEDVRQTTWETVWRSLHDLDPSSPYDPFFQLTTLENHRLPKAIHSDAGLGRSMGERVLALTALNQAALQAEEQPLNAKDVANHFDVSASVAAATMTAYNIAEPLPLDARPDNGAEMDLLGNSLEGFATSLQSVFDVLEGRDKVVDLASYRPAGAEVIAARLARLREERAQ